MMRPIATSLPGMIRDEKMTVSPSLSLRSCVPLAIRPSAARGSPCPPVAMISTSFSGSRIASSNEIGGGKSLR